MQVDGQAKHEPTPFAQFNKQLDLLQYSDHEYQLLLQDPAWSRAETDYLWKLVAAYDARFIVIHDVYDYHQSSIEACEAVEQPTPMPTTPPSIAVQRSLEDLKERYYHICHKLLVHRHPHLASTSRVDRYVYDKTRELDRKHALALMLARTPAQMREEEALFLSLKRHELQAGGMGGVGGIADQPWAREHESLVRLLGDHEVDEMLYAAPTSGGTASGPGTALRTGMATSRKRRAPFGHASRKSSFASLGGGDEWTGDAGPSSSSHKLERRGSSHLSLDGKGSRGANGGSAVLVSSQMGTIKAAYVPRVNAHLHDLGLGMWC
jgi:DNA methyltransferase 1-associated protein 1